MDRIRERPRQRVAEAPRPGGRGGQRVHGEAQEPQGRGRRAARSQPAPRRPIGREGPSPPLFPTTPRLRADRRAAARRRDRPRARPARPSGRPPAWPTHPRSPPKESYTNRLLKAKQRGLGGAGQGQQGQDPSLTASGFRSARFRIAELNASIGSELAESRTPKSGILTRSRPISNPRKGSSSMSVTHAESMEARAEEFRSAYDRVKAEIAKVIVGHDEIVHGVLTCLFVGGHALLEGVPGLGKTLLVRTLADAVDAGLQPHPVHARPDARRHHRHQHRDGAARRPPRLRVPAGSDLLADRAGRRDQPGHAQDAVGAAGGHAGAFGHGRRHDPPAQGAVLRHGHAEPDRAGGDLSPARGAARPVPAQAGRRLLDPRGAEPRSSTAPPGASGPPRRR